MELKIASHVRTVSITRTTSAKVCVRIRRTLTKKQNNVRFALALVYGVFEAPTSV